MLRALRHHAREAARPKKATDDYFLHVAVSDSAQLQRIIMDQLATRPEVGHAQTHLIFDRPLTAPVRPRASG